MNPFEALGRATFRAETAEEQVRQLSGLLKALKDGTMTLDAITVTEDSSGDADSSGDDNPAE